jgi:hypothetical protein
MISASDVLAEPSADAAKAAKEESVGSEAMVTSVSVARGPGC